MESEHPEWLPVDWKICVRVRSCGKKDKYYVNPSKDLKFNSKLEVLRYLKNAGNELKLRKRNKVEMKMTVTERLPAVQSKEIRITRNGGKTRRGPSTAGAEGEKLIEEKVDKTSSGNESVKSEGAAAQSIDPPETDALGQVENENDSTGEDQQQEKAAVWKKRKKHSKWMKDLPRRTSKRLARVEADPPLEPPTKTSSSAREADALTDEAEVDTIDKFKLSGKTEVDTSENFDRQTEASTYLPLAYLSFAAEHEGASVDITVDEKNDENLKSSLKDACVDIKEDEKNDENLKSSLNELLMDPCIEFAIKTLTGAIPLEDVNKTYETRVSSEASPVEASTSCSTPPISDIWADPCFEFAVKTLTSEIPMEDGSHFQSAFQQPLSSSGASGCNSITK